jgi:acetyltransferase
VVLPYGNAEYTCGTRRLIQKCFIDYDREMALVAERTSPETGQPEIIAVGRLSKSRTTEEGEVAVLVSDHYQGHGLGTELVRRLISGVPR